MGQTTDDLKQIAQIRKAILPLVDLAKRESDAKLEERLSGIETALAALLKKDTVVEVKAPEVNVTVDTTNIEKAVSKLQKSDTTPKPAPSAYEPHDQAKSQTYQYSGFVRSNGDWYIQRVAKGEQRYSKGSGGYSDAWEKRSKLKYGYLDESN